jgi:hypothetical protein
VAHPEFAERVDNGVDHGTQGRRRAAFAAGAHAKSVRRRGYFAERCRQERQRVGARHRVIHEARRQELPALRLVIAVLKQRLADALGNSAMRLTVQDQRIDSAPNIVHRGIADDLDLACFGIYFDFADLGAIRKARDRKRLVGDAGKWTLQILWQILARTGGRGNAVSGARIR